MDTLFYRVARQSKRCTTTGFVVRRGGTQGEFKSALMDLRPEGKAWNIGKSVFLLSRADGEGSAFSGAQFLNIHLSRKTSLSRIISNRTANEHSWVSRVD